MARHRHRARMNTKVLVNFAKLSDRLKALYSHWSGNKDELWASADAIVVETPPPSETSRSLMSSAFSIWFFGYELPGIVMVFMKKQIHLLCSKKKSGSFELLRKAAEYAVGVEVLIHVWNKKSGDNGDGSVIMNSIFPPVYHNMGPSIVGHIAAEAGEGDRVLEKWSEKLGFEGFRAADVSAGLGDLFVVKEEGELVCVKRAAYLSAKVMNNVVVPKLQKVIDHNEKKKDVDRTVLDEIEEAILQPSVKAGVMLKSRNVDACCHPYFQSYRANDELTHYDSGDVIKCSVGSRYKGYCSYVARSFLVDPNPCQTRAYEVILKAQEAAIAALRPGSRVGAAYVAASSLIGLEAPYLVKHLTKSVGTGIGLESQESVLDLNGTNDRLVKAGMVFNVCLGLENLKGAGQNSFSLLLADTVVVCAEGAAVVTQSCSNAVQDVTYTLSEDSDHDNRGGGGGKEEEKESSLIMPEKESNWRQHLAEALAPRKAVSPPKKLKLLSRPLRSPGLWICHPHFGGVGIGRKRAGALEAHANGFRYVDQWPENTDANRDDIRDGSSDDSSYGSTDDSTDDDTDDDADDDANTGEEEEKEEEEEGGFPDIMFANIKLAFYYHTKSPYGLMMHFCLYNQIEVGNKMTTDIQFYVEAVDEKRVFRGEEDGKAPRGPKYLREWMKFVRYVNASCMGIEIEVLDPSLCIEGMLQGSESPSVFKVAGFNLVEMTSLPFLVVKCEDIKMMKFERFDVEEKQQKDFDVLIVLKGLNKDELRIESISYTSLDVVKELLSVHNVRVNLGEHNKLKTNAYDYDSDWWGLNLVWQEEEEMLERLDMWGMKARDANEVTKKIMKEKEMESSDDESERKLSLLLFGEEARSSRLGRAKDYGNDQATSSLPPSKRLKVGGDEGGLEQM